MKNLFLVTLFTINIYAMQPYEIWTVVPGTWASGELWWNLGGDFFCALQKAAEESGAKVLPFAWSGKNNEKSRIAAAKSFAHLLSCFEPQTAINIVAHSHGATVALCACQMLAMRKPVRKIKALYALGVPIHEDFYRPNMLVIEKLYNLFSFNDGIQTIFDSKRVFTKQPGIVNLRVMVDGQEPTHTTLHCPIIAAWLPMLEHISCCDQGLLSFYREKHPEVVFDVAFEKLLASDKPIDLQALIDPRGILNYHRKR